MESLTPMILLKMWIFANVSVYLALNIIGIVTMFTEDKMTIRQVLSKLIAGMREGLGIFKLIFGKFIILTIWWTIGSLILMAVYICLFQLIEVVILRIREPFLRVKSAKEKFTESASAINKKSDETPAPKGGFEGDLTPFLTKEDLANVEGLTRKVL